MYKVIVDIYGGDNPIELVKGAVLAVNNDKELHVVLVGKEDEINEMLKGEKYNSEQISIIHASDIITNDDVPTVAIREKTDSSLAVTLNQLRTNEDIVGMVSAGSTGAVLTGAFMRIGRIKGVSRPGLCPTLPTIDGGIVALTDSGANVDSKPINLVHFAIMANAYVKNVYGIEKPRLALVSVGTEDKKGNELTKEVFGILKQIPEINFVGNMEARDVLSGQYDIVIADGFAGNVLLKSTEGAILSLLKLLKGEIKKSFISKIGALFMRKPFKKVKQTLDYNNKAGAVLLGCKKIVVKAHGSSKAKSVSLCIAQVVDTYKAKVCETIEKSITELQIPEMTE